MTQPDNLSKRERIWWDLIVRLMRLEVPRFIAAIEDRGGISNKEWEWLENEEENLSFPQCIMRNPVKYLICEADDVNFKQNLSTLIKGLAISSFMDEGIRAFDSHFSSQIDGYVRPLIEQSDNNEL